MTILQILRARRQQGYRTIHFPPKDPRLSDRYRGRPQLTPERCPRDCRACRDACPTSALRSEGALAIDLGRCLFCTDCVRACPSGAVAFTQDYRLSARTRAELIDDGHAQIRVRALDGELRRLFGRSLKLRQVSAGGCNACEADTNVLGTPTYDLARFGIQFVASPRHADGLLVTGPVTGNMELALRKTYAAVPSPRLVIAVGSCAISGGPYAGHPETANGVETLLPVDLYVPGCPPHPLTILDGLLRLLGRLA
jgi:Ni,Fe-hydrogenase III small subunit/Pyruvate/2-oxoacid:ferredoxin oxidoreductase delta subunit